MLDGNKVWLLKNTYIELWWSYAVNQDIIQLIYRANPNYLTNH